MLTRATLTRATWVRVHRYAGLFMALFLVVAGLTGSVLAFRAELDGWLNPPPAVAPQARPVLDPLTLRERLLAQRPDLVVDHLPLAMPAGDRAHATWVEAAPDPATGRPRRLGFQQVHQDPYSGAVLGTARPDDGVLPLTRENLLAVVYELHYRLLVPGWIGKWLFGVAALLWTLDCFVGAYLTFPLGLRAGAGKVAPPRKSWWARWVPAWQVKWGAAPYRLTLDLHRASGLWLWPMLFVVAWSAVGFNLPEQVYGRAMRALFGSAPDTVQPAQPQPPGATLLSWPDALARARVLMREQAEAGGFEVHRETRLDLQPEAGQFVYHVHSDRDADTAQGATYLVLEAHSGRLLGLHLPTGVQAGATVDHWLKTLHMARVGGLPFKAFVAALGTVVAFLSASGVYLWWKKRRARQVGPATRRGYGLA